MAERPMPLDGCTMLELDSPEWGVYSHAYGNASDIPALFLKLRAASLDHWEDIHTELTNAILHQGDVYTSTYAIAPHLLEYAVELGPGPQSEDLLVDIAYAARGGQGHDVPEELEEAWDDAQDEARDLILERLLQSETSPQHTGALIAGLLYLSGEWSAGAVVKNWCWGYALFARCLACDTEEEIFWHNDAPVRSTRDHRIEPILMQPDSSEATPLDEDLEFDEDLLPQQIVSLAAASGHPAVEQQMRMLFGTLPCSRCGAQLTLSPKDEDEVE